MAINRPNMTPHEGNISGETPNSRLDSLSGQHTSSIIVGILFIVVFIGFTIYLCTKEKYENVIISGFFSLLSLLGGFFAGSQISKK